MLARLLIAIPLTVTAGAAAAMVPPEESPPPVAPKPLIRAGPPATPAPVPYKCPEKVLSPQEKAAICTQHPDCCPK